MCDGPPDGVSGAVLAELAFDKPDGDDVGAVSVPGQRDTSNMKNGKSVYRGAAGRPNGRDAAGRADGARNGVEQHTHNGFIPAAVMQYSVPVPIEQYVAISSPLFCDLLEFLEKVRKRCSWLPNKLSPLS
jgi:hypothetical protein